MTNFELVIVTIYCLFAWAYMIRAFGFDNDRTWVTRLLTMILAILGIVWFPMVIAEDIWKKLNKEQQ